MKTFAGVLAAVAGTVFATTTFASDRASDAQYLAAARCQGIAQAAKLDSSQVDAFMKAQTSGRQSYIANKAEEARDDAKRQYRSAGSDGKRQLVTDEACARFATRLAAATTAGQR